MRYQNVSEAFIELEAAPNVAEKICMQSRDICVSIIARDNGRQLNFENGCAIVTVVDDGLMVTVSASDLLTFYGIQTVIEGRLWEIAPSAARSMTWLPARESRSGQFPRTATTDMRG
ncbi:SMa0974 family conjugal transfer regulator [Agrobacterium salinitolerans]|uniref:SMa0974 family conjugal transfer regulator n=1 Tax=Agrobacterium salinitolerans TaxID=1183413 RepID=UPI003F554265